MSLKWPLARLHVVTITVLICMANSAEGDPYEACGQTSFARSVGTLNFYYMVEGHRLVGGRACAPNAWPWTAQILWKRGAHRCGGALIDNKYVVTAAHCFSKSRNPQLYKVNLGGHKIGSGEEHAVRNISIHPLFNVIQPSSYDVALVRLDPPVAYSEKIRRICLPIFPPPDNKICIVTGWGHESEKGRRAATLREIHVPILSPFTCNDRNHYNGRLHTPSMFCAGYSTGGIDACQGDSGGPLFCERDGRWELQGLVSWGNGCARPFSPGVYSKVATVVPWIHLQMLTIG